MPLQIDPHTGKITYRGKEVGEHIFKDGRSTVQLNLEYEGGEDWIVPLSWFAYGLSMLTENEPAQALLTIETGEDSIADKFDVLRYLTEKLVKRAGYVWVFHKTDADDWPSPLHGHDYDKGLKLDAITGNVYDVGTKELCKKLKAGDLKAVQAKLRESKDFKDAAVTLIDNAAGTTDPV